jgi:hypothetical protein
LFKILHCLLDIPGLKSIYRKIGNFDDTLLTK